MHRPGGSTQPCKATNIPLSAIPGSWPEAPQHAMRCCMHRFHLTLRDILTTSSYQTTNCYSQVGDDAHKEVGDDAGGRCGSDERPPQLSQAVLAVGVAQAAWPGLHSRGREGGRRASQTERQAGQCMRQSAEGKAQCFGAQHAAATYRAGSSRLDAGSARVGEDGRIDGKDVGHTAQGTEVHESLSSQQKKPGMQPLCSLC